MGKRKGVVLLVLVLVLVMMCYAVAMVGGYDGDRGRREREEEGDEKGRREREEEEEEVGYDEGGSGGGRRREREEMFLLHEMKSVVRTDAGDMKVVKGFDYEGMIEGVVSEKPIHLGFITMEPKSLFIPQYLDSNLIIFVRRGEAKVGSIYKEDFVEKQLKGGDVYRIGAGSAFYLINTAEGQKLHIICSIDKPSGVGWGTFQSFFIGGGTNPMSVLSGFDSQTLATAFNVSTSEVRDFLTRQRSGPIVFLSEDLHPPNVWTQFVRLEQHKKLQHLKRMVDLQEAATKEDEEPTWSLSKIFNSVFGKEPNGEDNRGRAPDSYNLYDRKPDFRNNYGWSTAIDKHDYWPLGHSDIGLYLVNLTAGSMMAPHINPTATEYGIVLRGSGTVQVVFPNGTSAMKAKVSEGDVFWVPRYYPFCQIASRMAPFEFFGFSTSARRNRPQFLVGASSILQSMKGPEFAAAFGVSEQKLRKLVDAQQESIILPSASAAPPDVGKNDGEVKRERRRVERVVGRLGKRMIMDFD